MGGAAGAPGLALGAFASRCGFIKLLHTVAEKGIKKKTKGKCPITKKEQRCVEEGQGFFEVVSVASGLGEGLQVLDVS